MKMANVTNFLYYNTKSTRHFNQYILLKNFNLWIEIHRNYICFIDKFAILLQQIRLLIIVNFIYFILLYNFAILT